MSEPRFRVYDTAGYVVGDYAASELGAALSTIVKTRGRRKEVTLRLLTPSDRPVQWRNNRVHTPVCSTTSPATSEKTTCAQ